MMATTRRTIDHTDYVIAMDLAILRDQIMAVRARLLSARDRPPDLTNATAHPNPDR